MEACRRMGTAPLGSSYHKIGRGLPRDAEKYDSVVDGRLRRTGITRISASTSVATLSRSILETSPGIENT